MTLECFHPSAAQYNHASANNFPDDIAKYIDTETQHDTLMGPIDTSNFNFIYFCPHMSCPKGAVTQQVIVNLS
jgi:hypothetical protein